MLFLPHVAPCEYSGVGCISLPCRFMLRIRLQSRNRLSVIPGDWVRAQVKLNGFWQFHTGDDPRWASPSFDDSRWEPITVSDSWGNQEHSGYTGFAWYRRHLKISLVPGANTAYALLIPPVDDAYEIYWNGKLIGGYGKLPPRPHWYYTPFFRAFAVPSADSGTVAIRVWKSPLLFVDPGSLGGMKGPPPSTRRRR